VGKESILGIEAPLWSETVTKMDEIEYMVFPRLPGLAEIGWTAPSQRDWETYRLRLAGHAARMDAMGIDFFRSKQVPWPEQQGY
jgi:hexosaminidase